MRPWGDRGRKRETGRLSSEGVSLPGPGRDQRPQPSFGGEGAVAAVTVDAGRRENLGHPVQKFEGGETERGAAGGVEPWEEVEDRVGAAADRVESVEGEGGPGTVADQALEAGHVGSLDASDGVETEAATVMPGQKVLGVVGLQEAVATGIPQDPGADRVLEALSPWNSSSNPSWAIGRPSGEGSGAPVSAVIHLVDDPEGRAPVRSVG